MTNQAQTVLSRKQQKALSALVAQPTLALAAAQVGVTPRTLYRWLAENEAFRTEYWRLQREIVNNATYQLVKASNNAVNCLISVMNDAEAPPAARVAAAKLVLEMAFRSIEMDELEVRIAKLEEQIAKLGISDPKNGKGSLYPVHRTGR
jgi:hypothetical protein